MKVALDTNVLAYAEGINGAEMRSAALDLLERLPGESVVVPVQVLGELFHVLVRKGGRSRVEARDAILAWQDAYAVADTSEPVLRSAAELSAGGQLGIWDSVILSVASASGCRLLLSQDLQNGFTWNGVTVADPFAPVKNDLLEGILGTHQ